MFSYDAANRLTAAAHRNWNGTAWTDPLRYSESGITYDLNGNIKTYNRKGLISTGVYGDIDLLAYTYGDTQRPDRLTKVVDTGNATKGFKYNPPATGNHYAYDAVGNMTTDNHKKTTITYNYLNLPTVITFTDGTNRKIECVYDADGTKLTKTTSTGATVNSTKDYVGGIEYSGTNLEAIYFAEGRLTPNGAAFFYEYTIKDHLGNTRITFRANGASLTTLQENHYYPFGLEMEGAWQPQVGTENAYQYNGKELNEDFGLNWYDYGARWYDAAVGRWWSVDPLAEKGVNVSPYNYVSNNPLIMVDPTGMYGESANPDAWNSMQEDSKKVKAVSDLVNGALREMGKTTSGSTIYVMALKGSDPEMVKDAVDLLNGYQNEKGENIKGYLNAAGVNTTTAVLITDPLSFDITQMRKIDGVMVVGGTKKESAEYILANFDKGWLSNKYKDEISETSYFVNSPPRFNPEVTDSGEHEWGYVGATSTQMTQGVDTYPAYKEYGFSSAQELVAFTILHGMGHMAGIVHIYGQPDNGFMVAGPTIYNTLAGTYKKNVLQFIESTVNTYPNTIAKIQNRWK